VDTPILQKQTKNMLAVSVTTSFSLAESTEYITQCCSQKLGVPETVKVLSMAVMDVPWFLTNLQSTNSTLPTLESSIPLWLEETLLCITETGMCASFQNIGSQSPFFQ